MRGRAGAQLGGTRSGHLDLAWTYSFVDPGRAAQSRASRIFSSLQSTVRGGRADVALDAPTRSFREVNDELIAGYQAEEDARAWACVVSHRY